MEVELRILLGEIDPASRWCRNCQSYTIVYSYIYPPFEHFHRLKYQRVFWKKNNCDFCWVKNPTNHLLNPMKFHIQLPFGYVSTICILVAHPFWLCSVFSRLHPHNNQITFAYICDLKSMENSRLRKHIYEIIWFYIYKYSQWFYPCCHIVPRVFVWFCK